MVRETAMPTFPPTFFWMKPCIRHQYSLHAQMEAERPQATSLIECQQQLLELTTKKCNGNVLDPPNKLACLVCQHIAKVIHQVECCGKVFCKTCITTTKRRLNFCPNCHKASPKTFSDLHGAHKIECLRVSCENKEKGCTWSDMLFDYDSHKAF